VRMHYTGIRNTGISRTEIPTEYIYLLKYISYL
jgi:hypothetical protein